MKIINIGTIGVFILLFFNSPIEGQTKRDSMLLEEYNSQIKEIFEFQNFTKEKREKISRLNKSFCFINTYAPEKADSLIFYYFNSSLLNRGNVNKYLLDNYRCLTNKQKLEISNKLSQRLRPNDVYFHELISLYKVTSKINYLKENVRKLDLYTDLKTDLRKGLISRQLKFQMKSMATLINLGVENNEEIILEAVDSIYSYLKTEKKFLIVSFYSEIIPNSLSILNTKKSVINTLHYIDDKSNNGILSDDIALSDFSYGYYLFVVEPKLKESNIQNLARRNFDKNKNKIKYMLLNDDTIWKDHIR